LYCCLFDSLLTYRVYARLSAPCVVPGASI
jgi:hypothetical protein